MSDPAHHNASAAGFRLTAIAALLLCILGGALGCPEATVVRGGRTMLLSEAVAADYHEARRRIGRLPPERAISELERFIKTYDDRDEADLTLGFAANDIIDILLATGAETRALARIDDWLRTYPDHPLREELLIRRGDLHLRRDEYAQAEQAYGELAREFDDPDSRAAAAMLQAHAAALRADWPQAALHAWQAREALADAGRPAAWIDHRLQTEYLSRLTEEELVTLADTIDDEALAAGARWSLVQRLIAEHRYREALATLDEYLERYSGHENYAEAESLRLQLERLTQVRPLNFGVLLPLSGDYGWLGSRLLSAMTLALRDWPADERFDEEEESPQPRLIVRDTTGNAARALRLMEDLVTEENVQAIIGPLLPGAAEECATRAQELGVPLILLNAREGLADDKDVVFQMAFTHRNQAYALADYAVDQLGFTRFGILYPLDPYGRSMMNLFWDRLEEWRAEVTAVAGFPAQETDFQDAIRDFAALDDLSRRERIEVILQMDPEEVTPEMFPNFEGDAYQMMEMGITPDMVYPENLGPAIDYEALFIPAYFDTMGLIAPQLSLFDITDVTLLGPGGWNDPRLVEMADEYLRRSVFIDGFDANSEDIRVRRFVGAFLEAEGDDPGVLEAYAYDAVGMLRQALAEEPLIGRSELAVALNTRERFEGLIGTWRLDADGTVVSQPVFLTVRRHRIVPLR